MKLYRGFFPRTRSRGLFSLLVIIVLIFGLFVVPSVNSQSEDVVYTVIVEERIDEGTSRYVRRAISRAEEDDNPLIIKLNTPGGLVGPTRDLVDDILDSEITVVCWITPPGAWGFSAGSFILVSADVAAMNTGTSIGAARPQPDDNKTVQALATWIESISNEQGRPGDVARSWVTEDKTETEDTAFEKGVIDLIAKEQSDILDFLDLSEARLVNFDKGFVDEFLSVLSHPTVVMILLIGGLLGVVMEVITPGIEVPGIIGGIMLLLSFFGLRILSLNALGIVLLVLGVVLLAAEFFEPGFGIFGLGGGFSILLGIFFVGDEPWAEIASVAIYGVVIVLIISFSFLIFLVRKSQTKEPETGIGKIIGKRGRVTKSLEPRGAVKVSGERWAAVSGTHEKIKEGERIVVREITERDGQTTLVVDRISES